MRCFNARKLTAIAVTTFIMLQNYSSLDAMKLPQPEFNARDAAKALRQSGAMASHGAARIAHDLRQQEEQIVLLQARERQALEALNRIVPVQMSGPMVGMPKIRVGEADQGRFLGAQEEFQRVRVDLLYAQEALFSSERRVPKVRRDDAVFSKSNCIEKLAQVVACSLEVDALYGQAYGGVPRDEERSLLLRMVGYAGAKLKFLPLEFIRALERQAQGAQQARQAHQALVARLGHWQVQPLAPVVANPDVPLVEDAINRVLMTRDRSQWDEAAANIEDWIEAFKEFLNDYTLRYREKQREYEGLMESGEATLHVLSSAEPDQAEDAAPMVAQVEQAPLPHPMVVTTALGEHYLNLGLLFDTIAHFRLVAVKTPEALQAAKASIVGKAQVLRKTLMEMERDLDLFARIKAFIDEVEDLVRRKGALT